MDLFTSFDGRIPRKSFWLGVLGVILISIAFIFLLGVLFSGSGAVPSIIPQALSLALLYPMIAISIKRLHDRNKAAMPWIAIFFLPGLLSNIMQNFQIDYTVMEASEMMDMGGMMSMLNLGGHEILIPGKIAMLVGAVSMIVGVWALIELGFLKGTSGENSFGPDPLT